MPKILTKKDTSLTQDQVAHLGLINDDDTYLLLDKAEAIHFTKHHYDPHINPFNASPSFLAKNPLAAYFENKALKPEKPNEENQEKCMHAIYELVISFVDLERLVANPCSSDPKIAIEELETKINAWKGEFLEKVNALEVEGDERSIKLANKLKKEIEANTQKFLTSLNGSENPRKKNIFAAFDVGREKSLGDLIASNLDLVLNTGTKLAYHHSPYSIFNLFHVDTAIACLSDAKKDLHRHHYSLAAYLKRPAFIPYPSEMLNNVNPAKSDKEQFAFSVPQNNPSAAERKYRLAAKITKGYLYNSEWGLVFFKVWNSVFDIPYLVFVAINLVVYLLCNIFNIISLKYYSDSFDKAYQFVQSSLIKLYTNASELYLVQNEQNDFIRQHWKKHDLDEAILEKSLIKKTPILEMLEGLHFPKQKSAINARQWKGDVEDYLLKEMPLNTPEENDINVMQHQCENQSSSGMTKIGDIVSLLVYSGVDPFFRKSPLVATSGFLTSVLTLSAFISTSLIIPGTKLAIIYTQHLINQLNIVFCGKPANIALGNEGVGIFGAWQIAGLISDLPISMLQDRLGWSEDMKQKMPEYVSKFIIVAASAYLASFLPIVHIVWDKISRFSFINKGCEVSFGPIVSLLSAVTEEAHDCQGALLGAVTDGLIALKTVLVIHGWSHGDKIVYIKGTENKEAILITSSFDTDAFPSQAPIVHDITPETCKNMIDNLKQLDHIIKLKRFLHSLAYRDETILTQSQNPEVTHSFYLGLKKALDSYNELNSTHPIDGKALLDYYFNLYCQSNTCPNYVKLIIPLYMLWSLAEFALNGLYDSVYSKKGEHQIYWIRLQKHLENAMRLTIEFFYFMQHMLGWFIKVIWNYVLIGSIRSVVTLLGEACMLIESIFTNKTLKTTRSYLNLCEIDDKIAEYKIRHNVHSCLRSLFKITALLTQSTGIFSDIDLLAKNLLVQLDASTQQAVQGPQDSLTERRPSGILRNGVCWE